MNKLFALLAKGNVTIGRHSNGLGFFIRVGPTPESDWDSSSHGHILEETIENAFHRSNGEPEADYMPKDFEIGRHS